MSSRRDFLRKSGLLGITSITAALLNPEKLQALEKLGEQTNAFVLPTLPYAYNALEPFIDAQTMEIHHSKHHKTYVDNLNKALENTKGDLNLTTLLQDKNIITAVRNNGGGHYNHSLFWELLKPNADNKPNLPTGKLAEAINSSFKSFDDFKAQFSDVAAKHFGSGWCWLIKQNDKLVISTTANQDNPLMASAEQKGKPVLALDVWEHAYYLKHQNKRADYIANWWNIMNWEKAGELYTSK